MTQWVSPKTLLCKYEDLSSNFQYLCKKLGITMHAYKPKCWYQGQGQEAGLVCGLTASSEFSERS